MKKDELIKLGLDEETAEKVAAASAEELKAYVPKSRFDEVNTARKTAEDAVKERDSQIEGLRTSAGSVDELKGQIAALQADNKAKDEQHAAEMKALRIDNAVSSALMKAGALNVKAARALLDLEGAELAEDGSVKGLDGQIKALTEAEDSKFLFGSSKPRMKGARTGENGAEDGDGRVDTSKMSYDELCAYLAENPDAKLND
jgi:hypothetical protein